MIRCHPERGINMKHVISCEQYSRKSLEDLYKLTDQIVKNPQKFSQALAGKIVSIIFYEPSTRTRLSFESAVYRLGANCISTENAKADSSASKGETLEDTIRVIQGYSDAIVMRHSEADSSTRAAAIATVPILNAGAGGGEHPTQGLLDVYTIRKHKGKLDGLKVVILGDLLYGRTVHSMLKLISLYENITVYALSKKAFALPQEYIDLLKKRNVEFVLCKSFSDLPSDIDVMYHTRIQAERFEGDFGKEEFIINKKTLKQFSKDTLLLHPLPRLNEISTDVDDDPRALYFKQAHNGIPIRMALLLQVLGKA